MDQHQLEPQTSPDSEQPKLDANFRAAVQRLHRLTVYARWAVAALLWSTLGTLSLWNLKETISLLQQYFTWSALRYGLAYHLLAAIGLSLCVGVTVSTLVWQSRNVLFGLPQSEQQRLEKQVLKIRQQGQSHPLWKWLYPH